MEIRFLKDVTINDEAFKEGDIVETDECPSLDADTVTHLKEQEAVEARQTPPAPVRPAPKPAGTEAEEDA